MTHIQNVTLFFGKSIENVTCQVRALTAWMGGFGRGGARGVDEVWVRRGSVSEVRCRAGLGFFGGTDLRRWS